MSQIALQFPAGLNIRF